MRINAIIVLLLFCSFVNAEEFNISGKVKTKIIRNDKGELNFYQNNKSILTGSDFSIDGYSVLYSITGINGGFVLNLIGGNFPGYFNIYLENKNNVFYITKTITEYSYNEDSDTSVKISCRKDFNIKYTESNSEMLGNLLYSLDDKEFIKYCYSTEWKSL